MRARAVEFENGTPPRPAWIDVDLPEAAPGRVLIEVVASGLNRADLLQRDGAYRPPAGETAVPGLEVAGRVVAVGPSAGRWQLGDRVVALLGSGGHASVAVARHDRVLPWPDGLPATEAAALPEAVCTVWWNLVHLAAVQPGEIVLVHAANSGVGSIAVQVARALGARVVATTRGRRWDRALASLGASSVVDSTAVGAATALGEVAPDGVDIVLDLVGAAVAPLSRATLRRGGRWLAVGVTSGSEVTIDLREVIRRRIMLTGSSLRSLGAAEKASVVAGVARDLRPHVRSGGVRALVDRHFPAEGIAAALDHLGRGGLLGKVVLEHTGDRTVRTPLTQEDNDD